MTYQYDPTAFRDVFDHHFTFLAGFWRNTHRYAERLALRDTDKGRDWTYAELGEDVARVAAGLSQHGVGPGDIVTFQLFNGSEFALLYLASEHLGRSPRRSTSGSRRARPRTSSTTAGRACSSTTLPLPRVSTRPFTLRHIGPARR